MYTFEEVAQILDDLVDQLPSELLNQLNGIYLEPETKHNDKIPSDKYYVMGTFNQTPHLGKHISLYYGSIMALYSNADKNTLTAQLEHILRHELRHHVETLAGADDLIIEDANYVKEALDKLNQERSANNEQNT